MAEDKKQVKMEERSVDEEKEVKTNSNEQQEEKKFQNEQVEPIFAEGDKTDTSAEQQTDENHQDEVTDETAELKAKIEQLEKELDEKDNRLIRVQADFDNYRKRTRNEIEAIEKYRSQPLATELLTVVVRPVLLHARNEMNTKEHNEEIREAIQKLRKELTEM